MDRTVFSRSGGFVRAIHSVSQVIVVPFGPENDIILTTEYLHPFFKYELIAHLCLANKVCEPLEFNRVRQVMVCIVISGNNNNNSNKKSKHILIAIDTKYNDVRPELKKTAIIFKAVIQVLHTQWYASLTFRL